MQAKVKARGAGQRLVVTANRLRDGRVVWLAAGDAWTETLAQASVFGGEEMDAALAAAAAAERRQLVVGPYAAEVAATAAGPTPLSMRERVRMAGPGVVTDDGLLRAAE